MRIRIAGSSLNTVAVSRSGIRALERRAALRRCLLGFRRKRQVSADPRSQLEVLRIHDDVVQRAQTSI